MDLITILLSAYNEQIYMIKKSVESILSQTYTNIEVILINDNPQYMELDQLFKKYRSRDARVRYVYHEENKGLVYSLNEGIKMATGNYVARMDADDISYCDRLEKQIKFLKSNQYDMVGCNVIKIDENEKYIKELRVPEKFESIKKYQKYGNCMLHPTWLVKREVYVKLDGYRKIYACEDYDFVLRAIISGFKLGNLPEYKLYYRIRSNSISVTSNVKQKLTMYFLIRNGMYREVVSVEKIDEYLNSNSYKKNERKLQKYEMIKNEISISNKKIYKVLFGMKIIFNKYFYKNLIEYFKIKERQRYT